MNHRCAALLLLLLPAACAGTPDARKEEPPSLPPEELYRKMEQRLLAAGSLKIRARCDQTIRAESGTVERQGLAAFCFLRGEIQCAIEIRGVDRDGQTVGSALVSDGTRMVTRPRFSKPWVENGIPDQFDIVFLSLLHRIGLARTTMAISAMIGQKTFLVPSSIPAARNFRQEETKDGVSCISYSVPNLADHVLHAKLWYDAKTLRPLRRTVGVEDGKPGLICDETYEDYSLEAQLPDGPFVLPDLDPAARRRFATDGKSLIYEEREGGMVRFVVICDDGTEGETTDDGVILRRGSGTQTIKSAPGMMLLKGRRTMINAIPKGWNHGLVQEYHEYRAAHPKALISDWLKAALLRRPTPMLEAYLQED